MEDDQRNTTPAAAQRTDSAAQAAVPSIPELVAEVYEAAPPVERGRLLAQLLRPLGVLSLFGVAGGIFAGIRFRSGWPDVHLQPEDLYKVRAQQVMALADHAQQVSIETVDGLAQLLASSPALSGSAAAIMLIALLVRRARARQGPGAGMPPLPADPAAIGSAAPSGSADPRAA